MKKFYILLSFLMLASLFTMGQNIKHVSLNFNTNDFKMQQDGEGNYVILSDVHDSFLKEDTLRPALPYFAFNVLIGSKEQYDSHVCSKTKSLLQNNITMAQNPKAIPTNMLPPANWTKSAISYSQRIYPTEFVEYAGMNECDGYRVLSFHVCPFEYDVTAKKLYLRNHIGLDINLKPSPFTSRTRTGNRAAVRNTIRQMVINPEDLDEQQLSAGNRSNNCLTKQTGFEYIIVTSDQFKNTFQELANWKNRKGIRSKVLTVEHIDTTYTGSTTKEKIKRALADIDSLSYVLLGGDTLNVPTCMVYIGYYDANTDSVTPADVYYSCLGAMNWDSNGNGLNGEIGEVNDTISLIPVITVSRAPVSTINDARVFVDRIINYESAPDTTNWKNDILMCGNTLGYKENNIWYPYYVSGQSDAQIWSQMTYNQYINPSNPTFPSWSGELTRLYDTYSDISGDGTYDFNVPNLQTELSKGYTFVDVKTHGNKIGWQLENYNFYYWYKANELENCGSTIITTTACQTNAFDFNNMQYTTPRHCLSQHFINNPQSGILAYWGTSRENWYRPRQTNSLYLGDVFNALTYRKIIEDKFHRLGKAAKEVKIEKMSEAIDYSYYSSERKIWMGLNLMGDPEMPVFLSKPEKFQNVSIQFVNDSIYVDAGVGGFDICFINQNDSTDYYIARDIADSVAAFGRLNGVFDVCITKPDYIPYTTTCGTTYLQDITLAGMKTYETGKAIIGSDVTNIVAHGPVVINSGNTTVKAIHGATITKDFEVKLGAEFTITNQ